MSELSHQGAIRLIYKRHLNESERQGLKRHLRACADCRQDAEMAFYLSRHLALKQIPTRPSPQLTATYMESAARRNRRSQIMKPLYAIGGAVALALIMLAGWYIMRPESQSVQAVMPTEPAVAAVATAEEARPLEAQITSLALDQDALDEQLMAAVEAGDGGTAAKLLEAGADPNCVDGDGHSPLPMAARDGQLAIVQELLDADAGVDNTMDGRDPDGFLFRAAPALLYAAAYGHLDVVDLLLANGADPNKAETFYDFAPLHQAAAYNHADVVKKLLASGADIEQRTMRKNDATPLHWAVAAGSLEAAEALLQAGADPDVQDEEGSTALHYAAEEGNSGLVELLIEYRATLDIQNNQGQTALDVVLTDEIRELLRAAASRPGKQELIAAVKAGDEAKVSVLLAAGAEFDSVLPIAAQEGNVAIVQLLLDAGADVDSTMDGRNPEGFLYRAAPALLYAAAYGRSDVVDLLLANGADPNKADTFYELTALHDAAAHNHVEIVEMLVAAGANIEQREGRKDDRTPLHWAVGPGALEAAEALLKAGADPDVQDEEGNTALHYAAGEDYSAIIELLIEYGASLDIENIEGKTALDVALSDEVRELLREAGAGES